MIVSISETKQSILDDWTDFLQMEMSTCVGGCYSYIKAHELILNSSGCVARSDQAG